MEFLKAGEPVESNIFNQLDEKKRALIDKGVDVINLSIGTPDFQPDQHVMEDEVVRPCKRKIFSRTST